MDCIKIIEHIVKWLEYNIINTGQKGFVIGVSGGIDSAVVSTLCAETGFPVICVNMPINQVEEQYNRSNEHIAWLQNVNKNVTSHIINLSDVYNSLCNVLPSEGKSELSLVNSRSRIRMIALYSIANTNNYLVCGTGNKVEDYGIGFFTKYGDGGVDISPIGDLLKSEVFKIAEHLNIINSIRTAEPTDGLWETDLTDEDQIGATYNELEWAMNYCSLNAIQNVKYNANDLNTRQIEVLNIYISRHNSNLHKMKMPPICDLNEIIQ